jgi:hypothetical protein
MSDNKAVQRFFGYVLMAVGGLITVLCGGCTLVFLALTLPSGMGQLAALTAIGTAALIVGGIPTAIGVVVFAFGRRMAKDESVQTFSAYGLMAFGGLIAVLFGGCTAFILWGTIHSSPYYRASDTVFFAPIIAGVPTVVGVWAFLKGWAMLRQAKGQADRDIDSPYA